jgi:hypothetical protein
MNRLIYDIPRWHLYLHRDARGLNLSADPGDGPTQKLADELFGKLYADDDELMTKPDKSMGTWAEELHQTCDELPSFKRLVCEVHGDAYAAGVAVEKLLEELNPQIPKKPEPISGPVIRRAINAGCDKASSAVDEAREALEGLAGVGFSPGNGHSVDSSGARELARRLHRDPRLRLIAKLAGRFKRIAAAKLRQKVRHGADEVCDIECGDNLGKMLPVELAKLTHPTRRLLFLKNLVERQCLQYQLRGTDRLGKGPLVVCLDKSDSMCGPKDTWSTAVALALLEVAQRDRRPFALLGFDTRIRSEHVVKPGQPLPEEALFVSCDGGTDIDKVMRRALEVIKLNPSPLKKADVVLISDGESDIDLAPQFRQEAQQAGVDVMGIAIENPASALSPWCDTVESVVNVNDLDDTTAEKLFTL